MNQKGLAPLLLVLLLALGIGGYLLYQKQNIAPSTQQTVQSSASVNKETASWETYEDVQRRYSFKYPKGWKIVKSEASVKISNEGSSIDFQISPYPSIDFDKLYEKPGGTVNQNPVFIRTKIKNLDISGFKSTMYTNESSPSNHNKGFDISVYIIKGAPITMVLGNTGPNEKEAFLSTFNQVLSSLNLTK